MEQQVVVRRGGRGNNINKAYCESGLPQPPQRCPRCESMNTKFCYFNNYSLSQPRYFCKSCKRYWTQGGSLRNVPIGGGSRKGKRAKTTTSHDEVEVVPTPPPMDSSASPFYGVGGYLSSLQPAFHNSFNPSSSSLINSPNLELGGNREVEEGGLGGLILTTMNSHHHDWSQTFMPSNGNGIVGSSSSLIPNHDQLPHLPGFGPLP